MKLVRVGVALALLCAAVACDTADPTQSINPQPTAVPPTVETFSGTVNPGSSDFKPFNINLTGGTLAITLTAAGPPATIPMGIGLGSSTAAVCTLFTGATTVAPAGNNPQLQLGPLNAGSYCVEIFDAGTLAAPVSYAVTVTHY
jgi:hypothetical protein